MESCKNPETCLENIIHDDFCNGSAHYKALVNSQETFSNSTTNQMNLSSSLNQVFNKRNEKKRGNSYDSRPGQLYNFSSSQDKTKETIRSKKNPQRIKLNVGGKHFETTISTLKKFADKNHFFIKLLSETWIDALEDEIFIDRNGDRFNHILDFLRDGKFFCPDETWLLEALLSDSHFYCLEQMAAQIESRLDLLKEKQYEKEYQQMASRQMQSGDTSNTIALSERQGYDNKILDLGNDYSGIRSPSLQSERSLSRLSYINHENSFQDRRNSYQTESSRSSVLSFEATRCALINDEPTPIALPKEPLNLGAQLFSTDEDF